MPDTSATTEAVIATCSFCGKSNSEVETMVAGPGVFICNECVELSGTIVAATSRLTPEDRAVLRARALDRSPEEILAMLPGLAAGASRAEVELSRWVERLRQLGTGWPQIADALGTGIAAARQRFDPAPPASRQ